MKQATSNYRLPIDIRDELKKRAEALNMPMTDYLRHLLIITKDKQ